MPQQPSKSTLYEIFIAYSTLAFTTFGGPQAHIALFHELFVEKLKWIQNKSFVELFAIAQSLPGPASTQLAYSVAFVHGGIMGALISFFLWSIPMMLVMMGVGIGLTMIGISSIPLWAKWIENGLTSAAVGLVALAAYKLGTKIITDLTDTLLALFSFCMSINLVGQAWLFPSLMAFGGVTSVISWKVTDYLQKSKMEEENEPLLQDNNQNDQEIEMDLSNDEMIHVNLKPKTGIYILIIWALILIMAILTRMYSQALMLQILSTFYFVGSIIFGGGPVVIPLLQEYLISNGWLSTQEFLLGLAFINVLPGYILRE